MRPVWLAVGAACAVALTGCGSAPSPRPQIRRALAAIGVAVRAGDARALCSAVLFFPPRRPRAELLAYLRALREANLAAVDGACTTAFAAAPQRLPASLGRLVGARLGPVSASGSLARVGLREPGDRAESARFVRAGRAWRLLLDAARL